MGWKELAQTLKNFKRQAEIESTSQLQQLKEEFRLQTKQDARLVNIWKPRVKKVVVGFARSLRGGILDRDLEDHSGTWPEIITEWLYVRSSHNGKGDFTLYFPYVGSKPNPKKDWIYGLYVELSIDEPGISIKSRDCSDVLFSKCKNRVSGLLERSGYYRSFHAYPQSVTQEEGWWTAGYLIRFPEFTEDKFAVILEEFCKDAMQPGKLSHSGKSSS